MTQQLVRPVVRPELGYGLKKSVLSPVDVLGQSIAGIAPTAAPAFSVAISFGLAGNATWLAYAIATGMLLLTALSINQFTRRSSTPGSLYTYVTMGLGTNLGIVTGLSLVAAYVCCACAALCQTTMFFNCILQSLCGKTVNPLFGIIAFAIGITYIAYRNIQLSTKTMLWLEAISILLIISLFVAIFGTHIDPVDHRQLTLTGMTPEGVHLALILAIFAFVGFESAASLGVEARNPKRTIPFAIVISTLFSGLFFVVSSYIIILASRKFGLQLEQCQTPLSSLSTAIKLPVIGVLTSAGAGISLFAAALAGINAAARILLMMSHDGILHSRFSNSHAENQTPHIAVFATTSMAALGALFLTALGVPLLDIVGWVASFGTYGFIVAYFMVSLAAPFYLKNTGQLNGKDLLLAALSCLTVIYALIGTVYPVPAAPYNFLPYLFIAYLTIGVLWLTRSALLSLRAPQAAVETVRGHD